MCVQQPSSTAILPGKSSNSGICTHSATLSYLHLTLFPAQRLASPESVQLHAAASPGLPCELAKQQQGACA